MPDRRALAMAISGSHAADAMENADTAVGPQPAAGHAEMEEDSGIPIYGDPREAPPPTVDEEVRGVATPEPAAPVQPALWRWIEDNVDFRVGLRVFLGRRPGRG